MPYIIFPTNLTVIGHIIYIIFPTNLTVIGSEFHRVGAATEKALVPTFDVTLGPKSRLELDDRSCLGCLARVRNECNYAGCLDSQVYCQQDQLQWFWRQQKTYTGEYDEGHKYDKSSNDKFVKYVL